jgi:hypothetical protein
MIPINEYAAKIGKAPTTIRQKCQRGTLPGAVKIGRDWLIPEDAPYPDNREKSGKYKNWRKRPAE